jgi:drug/metabolite transporter (DMT)-like permease
LRDLIDPASDSTVYYVLALASAVFYGAADFIGGITARRANTIAIVIVSQFAGLLLLGIALPLLPAASPAPADWWWGAAAGLTGGIGVALLYRALAAGVMSVVAPITAVCAVVIPVGVSLIMGERPGPRSAAGIALAIVAVALVSQSGPNSVNRPLAASGIGLALAAGVSIGLFFLSLARTNAAAGLWPLFAARAVSVSVFGALAAISRRSLQMPIGVASTASAGGALDMLANLLYLIATRRGPLSVTVTLASLYPASTVILARVILGERLTVRQSAGIACAFAAVVLIVGAR